MQSFAEETTIHGLAEFYKMRAVFRVVWAFSWIGVVVFFGISSEKLIKEFINQSPTTSMHFTPIQLPPLALFPPISGLVNRETLKAAGIEAEDDMIHYLRNMVFQSTFPWNEVGCDQNLHPLSPTNRSLAFSLIESHGGLTKFAEQLARANMMKAYIQNGVSVGGGGVMVEARVQASHAGIKLIYEPPIVEGNRWSGYVLSINHYD